ncbi:polysaccharide pyruvyl transferase family protein [Sutcliffiella horikoshii]|uniref:polysaccharide pyruvyl transferase family protein n=1 Tax=Sutcliffiella horikoshii TaxID=79883 RepID=UPI001CBEB319|nr:polysaccharide pyruvyl transferase family protein [Sutcliffiella horikoshii]UAL46929.1 polysaccharide pyruvyl transferase family protein [Sutcliffiella horikoshii]
MKNVFLEAYTNVNLGDDLFIKILCERYPQVNFILFAPKEYKRIFKKNKNIKCFSNSSYKIRLIDKLFAMFNRKNYFQTKIKKSCIATVKIGGSMFIQSVNWRKHLDEFGKNTPDNPYFLLGANFGPYDEEEYYGLHQRVFKEYTDICFRESLSYALFKQLPNVRVADDIVFNLKTKLNGHVKNEVFISVIKPSYRNQIKHTEKQYFETLSKLIIKFIQNSIKVNLVGFCQNEGDNEGISTIIDIIPQEYQRHVNAHQYTGNIDEILELMSRSKYVIATRFHAMILAWLYKKPVLPLVYSQKMQNIIDDVGFKGLTFNITEMDNLDPEEVLFSLKSQEVMEIKKQVVNSRSHFLILDQYLSG